MIILKGFFDILQNLLIESCQNSFFQFCHIRKNLFSKTVPYFWWLRLKLSYNVSKNLLRWFIGVWKHIEFHLPHYEIPQPSPRYCRESPNNCCFGHEHIVCLVVFTFHGPNWLSISKFCFVLDAGSYVLVTDITTSTTDQGCC